MVKLIEPKYVVKFNNFQEMSPSEIADKLEREAKWIRRAIELFPDLRSGFGKFQANVAGVANHIRYYTYPKTNSWDIVPESEYAFIEYVDGDLRVYGEMIKVSDKGKYTFSEGAGEFIDNVEYPEAIRERLKTYLEISIKNQKNEELELLRNDIETIETRIQELEKK